ncbi:MAG: PLP-dependent aminotransferase family protein [Oscillospiraceae bacterium]|nr:PLP-dependent aminotransferase family protein [Oscillospiraceae bacterium]
MIKFASRMDNLKGSAIRELLALTSKPEVLSFAGGLPASELFPVEKMKAATDAVMNEQGKIALQYSTTEGFLHFREQIAERMCAKNNIKTSADNILVTSGSQQGLDYSARVFCDKGDVIIIESPSYLGALNAFKTCEPNFVAIPTDENGMIMEELEKVLATTERVKMIYVIPDFQNPSGRTWPLERRKQFMEIVNKYEIPVVEDNPYGELRFEGENMPALKSLDTKGLVVFLGTFSKILAPGYRLGWVCAEGEILKKYNFMAQASALQASTEAQLVISKFIDMFDLDEHVAAIKDCYRKRRDAMIQTMEKEFPPEAKFTHPNGGLFTWVELPEYINTNDMAKQCLERNVAYVPGADFFPEPGHNNCMRLNYSCMPEDKIVQGMTVIGEVIKANIKK